MAVCAAVVAFLAFSCCQDKGGAKVATVEQGFDNVPDSIRLAVYWYWINDNISREGVTKDLEAMKAAGITRAFIGNIETGNVPYGKVGFMSDEWWEVTRTAMKKAGELDIELGMFNCPGWSQSGGPWIDEDRSMRYVAFDSRDLTGDGTPKIVDMPDVPAERIVGVFAYPALKGRREEVSMRGEGTVKLKFREPMTARTLLVDTEDDMEGWMKVIKDGQELTSFYFNRSNHNLQVGFDPDAPYVVSLPETSGNEFEFNFESRDEGTVHFTLTDIPYMEAVAEKSFAKMFQSTLPPWDFYMWDTQCVTDGPKIDGDDIVDLSAFISADGKKMEWTAPRGEWNVVVAYTKTTGVTNAPAVPAATGLEVDKMSLEHIRYHFDKYLGEILRRIPAEDRKSFRIAVEDSYETGGQNWTDNMPEIFEKTYGYSPLRYLPVLQGYIVDSEEMSERFLWDLRRLVSDMVAYNYVGGLRDVCHEHGLKSWLENYGHWGFPGEFLQYGGQSDQVSGEFWAGDAFDGIEVRDASSCSHIYGKKQTWAESCTSGDRHFQRYPALLKRGIDDSFISGINSTLLHLYIEQPYESKPGINAWFGTEFNRHNTWFSFFDLFSMYIRRCNFLLQQGDYVADAAYFIGEDAPKMAGVRDPALPDGYSYDYINAEVLKKHAKVKNGVLVLDSGMRYRVLVLPPQTTMRPEMLECIAGLVSDGLTIVGPKPVKSPSLAGWPDADTRVASLAEKLWKEERYGKGKAYPEGTSLETVFADLGVAPDCLIESGDAMVRFIHRRLDDAEIYFFSNNEDRPVTAKVTFRDSGYEGAQLWDAVTGCKQSLVLEKRDGMQSADLELGAYGSAFIVLRDGVPAPDALEPAGEIAIEGPWEVAFEETCCNAPFKATFSTTEDWAASSNPAIKYFSGTAHYRTSFKLDALPADRYTLDLGKVMVVAKVRINGQYVGGVWTDPYVLDVTGFLKEGENEIEVDVANNWINAIVGDSLKPASKRRLVLNVNPVDSDGFALQTSGLLGPVRIVGRK